ncbi:hypothetical protein [Pelagovum pacificum]|uniref:Uncharacterized protein n=1 Tax=Pelagovum pacificum TaxID=2588711 RepID=A0A5C5GCM6_9RHOB|nr:hypothetical protein [Pelagovum pacificum]QQA44467.1 hypothetical protein I8N54_07830 [Pelagovum pacificum]TNY32418.1 hypothetical protein FHY64_03745 [Pelagovum pacificum]
MPDHGARPNALVRAEPEDSKAMSMADTLRPNLPGMIRELPEPGLDFVPRAPFAGDAIPTPAPLSWRAL